ncbi:MAG: hypothetical protein QOE06_2063 [Thermoleophilaceae bacterium]|jgi:hypothetical protein|nr:hypothetical protein [Thermoleophilaceae bacterium]
MTTAPTPVAREARAPAPPAAAETGSPARSPALARGEIALVIVAGIVLSILMNWPLPAHLGTHIAQDLGDPTRTAWQLAWVGHALVHDPANLYQSNAFWPLANSLGFSDSLIGYAPAGVVGNGVHAAVVRYNLLFLFSYALCFVGAYLLARELGVRRIAAVVAGVAFAYAPFRLTMNGHLHVISSGGIPLALFFMLRGYRRESAALVAVGWLVAAWQLSLGFTLGLQLVYLLAVLGVVVAVWWWRSGRPAIGRRVIAATLAGMIVLGAVSAVQARPLLRVAHDYPTAKRDPAEVAKYSAPPKAFLSAPVEDRVWGGVTKPVRRTLRSPNEQNQFPGLVIFLLAVIGLVAGSAYSRRLRIGLAVAIAVVGLLSLGFGVLDGRFTYRLVLDHAPGWNGVRTPGRLITLTSLGLALLAAAGTHRLLSVVEARRRALPPRMGAAVPVACAVVLAGAVLVEGRGSMPNPSVPPAPAALAAAPAPQLELPANAAYDRLYQLWSVDRFQPIVNGVSTFPIPSMGELMLQMDRFPSRRTVGRLRRLGVRTVLIHLDVTRLPLQRKWKNVHPPDLRRMVRRPVAGLPLRRTRAGSVIRYDLKPVAHPTRKLTRSPRG